MARLNNDQKDELCQMLAERRTFTYITSHFKQVHDLIVYHSQIIKYRGTKKWAEIIQEKRETWDKDLASEYLASKRNRLMALEEARVSAIEGGFTGTDKESGREIHKNSPAAAVAAIKQAQEELEGKKIRLAGHDGGELMDRVTAIILEILPDGAAKESFLTKAQEILGQKLIEGG